MNLKPTQRKQLLKTELWYRGDLTWKLKPHQFKIYDFLHECDSIKRVVNCSRRYGKTTVDLIDVIECGIKNAGWTMPFVAPTKDQIREIVMPIMDHLTEDCPIDIKPVYNTMRGAYIFPHNGSIINLAGTDNKHYEKLRGRNAHKAKIDEAGSCTNLMYILDDIIMPQTLTTGGHIDLLSTPPKTPAHDFYFIAQEAKSKGAYIELDIDSNSSLDQKTKELYLEEAGGRKSTTAQREYFCQFVTDSENAVIPEFDQEKEKILVKELDRPAHYNVFSALDPGFSDYTGYVTGHYDFVKALYVVENEAWLKHGTTPEISREIMKCESIYGAHHIMLRVSDTDPRIIADMATQHGIHFVPTQKDNLDAQVNAVRTLVRQNRIYFHPRCKNLIRQVKTAIWNDSRTTWEKTRNDGHFDLLAALIYWVRNVNIYDNPYPDPTQDVLLDDTFVNPYRVRPEKTNERALKEAFNL